eukprot:14286681-Alexandrium_andersonii.AAC.1
MSASLVGSEMCIRDRWRAPSARRVGGRLRAQIRKLREQPVPRGVRGPVLRPRAAEPATLLQAFGARTARALERPQT